MEKFCVIKICGNYVFDINGGEFIRAKNKKFATKYLVDEARELIKPWGDNAIIEEI